jgi:hypothetical protein
MSKAGAHGCNAWYTIKVPRNRYLERDVLQRNLLRSFEERQEPLVRATGFGVSANA